MTKYTRSPLFHNTASCIRKNIESRFQATNPTKVNFIHKNGIIGRNRIEERERGRIKRKQTNANNYDLTMLLLVIESNT